MTGYNVQDVELTKSLALPNGAATTNSSGIDLGNSDRGDFTADCEVVVTIPTLTTGQLGDTQTITYSLRHDDDSAFGSDAELQQLAVQTGAGGAGAAGSTVRVRLPSNVARYLRLRAVKTGASNASTGSATLSLRT